MENLIKEGFAFDQLSSTRFEANAAKLQTRVLANNLQAGFRLICVPESWKKKELRMDTVRLRLIKICREAGPFQPLSDPSTLQSLSSPEGRLANTVSNQPITDTGVRPFS